MDFRLPSFDLSDLVFSSMPRSIRLPPILHAPTPSSPPLENGFFFYPGRGRSADPPLLLLSYILLPFACSPAHGQQCGVLQHTAASIGVSGERDVPCLFARTPDRFRHFSFRLISPVGTTVPAISRGSPNWVQLCGAGRPAFSPEVDFAMFQIRAP